jgi:hypothetical protein
MSKSSQTLKPESGSTRPLAQMPVRPRQAPTTEQIAHRAYEIFLARGGEHGHDQEDWAQAERELKLGLQ